MGGVFFVTVLSCAAGRGTRTGPAPGRGGPPRIRPPPECPAGAPDAPIPAREAGGGRHGRRARGAGPFAEGSPRRGTSRRPVPCACPSGRGSPGRGRSGGGRRGPLTIPGRARRPKIRPEPGTGDVQQAFVLERLFRRDGARPLEVLPQGRMRDAGLSGNLGHGPAARCEDLFKICLHAQNIFK